ncbi:MAG: DUF4097 family beta strand repeat protein [Acidobacteria bacterium]|nr:DUF4097 family beta strand repeat protein [Acidobacteriota bacterium]
MSARALTFAMSAVLMAASLSAAQTPRPAPSPAPAAPATPATPQPPVQARPGWTDADESPRTDQTMDVAKGTRLVLSSHAGEVTVRAWDRDAVRVQATHASRDRVDVQMADNTLRIRTRSARGPGGVVDYTLTVPRWMPVNLSGTYLAATIEGTTAEVNVETVGGDLTLKGGSGAVSLRSIEGEIRADGASGKLNVSTVNDSITLSGVAGDVVAETVNGDVTITNAKASSLEVSTVNGDVRFESTVSTTGTYRVSTHQGDIRVSLGQQASATVFVRTFRGDFSSDFPVTLPKEDSGRDSNKRFNFTLGAGGARVELQSFQGDIHVAKGPLRTREEERARRRNRAGRDGIPPLPPLDGAIGAELAADVAASLRREFGPEWQADMERLSDLVGRSLAPLAPPPALAPLPPMAPLAPPPPPAPVSPRAPRPPRG